MTTKWTPTQKWFDWQIATIDKAIAGTRKVIETSERVTPIEGMITNCPVVAHEASLKSLLRDRAEIIRKHPQFK